MNPLLRIRSLSLFGILFLSANLHAQHIPRRGENLMFSATAAGGLKSHYPYFTLERSLGRWSVSGSLGGGIMGSDLQQALFSDARFIEKHIRVVNSKTLTEMPNHIGENTYLWRTKTNYTGAMFRGGLKYYFGRQGYQAHLGGFYAGVELIYIRTYEYQVLTYREKNGDSTWSYDGMNSFNTFAMSFKAGYNWYPRNNQHFCLSAAIARPFYMPFTEEINLSSPLTAAQWELELGFGYRIAVR